MRLVGKRILLLLCGLLVLAIPVSLLYVWGSSATPGTDNTEAELTEALTGTLPVLVALHSKGCKYCQADQKTLDELEESLAGELVIVRVDVGTEYGQMMAQKLGLKGVPAYFLIDPTTEDLLYAQTGPLNVERLLDALP